MPGTEPIIHESHAQVSTIVLGLGLGLWLWLGLRLGLECTTCRNIVLHLSVFHVIVVDEGSRFRPDDTDKVIAIHVENSPHRDVREVVPTSGTIVVMIFESIKRVNSH